MEAELEEKSAADMTKALQLTDKRTVYTTIPTLSKIWTGELTEADRSAWTNQNEQLPKACKPPRWNTEATPVYDQSHMASLYKMELRKTFQRLLKKMQCHLKKPSCETKTADKIVRTPALQRKNARIEVYISMCVPVYELFFKPRLMVAGHCVSTFFFHIYDPELLDHVFTYHERTAVAIEYVGKDEKKYNSRMAVKAFLDGCIGYVISLKDDGVVKVMTENGETIERQLNSERLDPVVVKYNRDDGRFGIIFNRFTMESNTFNSARSS